MPFLSVPVDTSRLPQYFSKLPVRLHVEKDEIQKFTLELVNLTKKEGTKAHKHAYYRHAVIGADLNVYALTWCEADLAKLKLLIEFVELIWSHDDVTEEIALSDALPACEQLRRAMYKEYDNEPTTDGEFGIRIRRFRDLRERMIAVDAVGFAEVIDDMEEWLPIDNHLKDWTNIDEYLQLRKTHVGNGVMTTLIRWTMGIHLTKAELAFIKPFVDNVGMWLGLMNDFFSWKKERTQKTDRVINSTKLLMNLYNLPEDAAVDMLRGLLVKQEVKIIEMGQELKAMTGLSTGMRQYIEGLELYAGATFYWSMLAPRYQKPIE